MRELNVSKKINNIAVDILTPRRKLCAFNKVDKEP